MFDYLIELILLFVVGLECIRSGDMVLFCFCGFCCSIIWSEIMFIIRRVSEIGFVVCGGGFEVYIG